MLLTLHDPDSVAGQGASLQRIPVTGVGGRISLSTWSAAFEVACRTRTLPSRPARTPASERHALENEPKYVSTDDMSVRARRSETVNGQFAITHGSNTVWGLGGTTNTRRPLAKCTMLSVILTRDGNLRARRVRIDDRTCACTHPATAVRLARQFGSVRVEARYARILYYPCNSRTSAPISLNGTR